MSQRGFTLIEVMLSTVILIIVVTFSVVPFLQTMRMQTAARGIKDIQESWDLLRTGVLKGLGNTRADRYQAAGTRGRTTTGSMAPLTTGSTSPIYRMNPSDLIAGEGTSAFLNPILGSIAGQTVHDVFQDSFTLELYKIDSAGGGGGANKVLTGIIASRCVPVTTSRFHPDTGSSIDHERPRSSAVYVLGTLDRRPFYHSNQTQPNQRIHCCPANDADGLCTSSGPESFVARSYLITFSEAGAIQTTTEMPAPGEQRSMWGLGFMIEFDRVANPDFVKFNLFSQANMCGASIAVRGCVPFSPAGALKNLGAGLATYLRDNLKLRTVAMNLAVSKNVSTSGIIRLDQ